MLAEVLRSVRGVINPPFGADLTSEDIALRVRQLNGRYITYKKVVATNGVYWNMKDKVVVADESTWKLIFQAGTSQSFIVLQYFKCFPILPHLWSVAISFDRGMPRRVLITIMTSPNSAF